MSQLKFHHVFFMLMLTAGISAFGVQTRLTNRVKGPFQAMFVPVASPSKMLMAWGRSHVIKEPAIVVSDANGTAMGDADVRRQNEELRRTVANLAVQLEELHKRSAVLESVGAARPYCTLLGVFGTDSGARSSLLVNTAGVGGLRAGMPVLFEQCIVGRLETAGTGSAQVKLATDAGFRVSGAFRRLVQGDKGQVESQPMGVSQTPLVEGDGRGRMLVRNIDMKEVQAIGLTPGDWVVLDDSGPDWPLIIQGYKLGEVSGIRPRTEQPLYAQIEVRPPSNWMLLREVMVMNKGSGFGVQGSVQR